MAAAVVGVCAALMTVGVVLAVAWGRTEYAPLPAGVSAAQRYARGVLLVVIAGVGAGVLMAGPGGRLAMRLLAETAPAAAVGRATEADEIVGRVTLGGTIGFMIFIGLGFGFASACLYLLVRRWLPPPRWGGLAFGALLLLVPALVVDPLRKDNPDFEIVGPGWVALLVFSVLALAHGALVAALVHRLSHRVPAFVRSRRAAVWYAPLLVLVIAPTLLVPVALGGVIVAVLDRVGNVRRALASPAALLAGRVALGATAVAAAPFFATTARHILAASP